MKRFTKALSMLLAIIMVVGLLPLSIIAEDIQTPVRYTVLLLDTEKSFTMTSGGVQIYEVDTPIDVIKEAAKNFVDQIQEANGTNYVAVISYSSTAKTETGFTADSNTLTNAIDKISIGGQWANINAALEQADSLLSSVTTADAEKNIVLFTQGINFEGEYSATGHYSEDDCTWLRTDNQIHAYEYANVTYETAQELHNKYSVYTIGLFQKFNEVPEEGMSLLNFAKRFSADLQNKGFYDVEDVDDLPLVFEDVAEDIINPLEISLTYTNTVVVQLNGNESYIEISVNGTVTNKSNATAINTKVRIDEMPGLGFISNDMSAEYIIGDLAPKASTNVTWKLKAEIPEGEKQYQIKVVAGSNNSVAVAQYLTITVDGNVSVDDFPTEDRWSFEHGMVGNYTIDEDSLDWLLSYYSNNTTRESLRSVYNNKNLPNSRWGGSCHGMSIGALLFRINRLSPAYWNPSKASISELTVEEARSLINYYYILQFAPEQFNVFEQVLRMSDIGRVQTLEQMVNDSAVAFGFNWTSEYKQDCVTVSTGERHSAGDTYGSGHTVIAYGEPEHSESGWTVDSEVYHNRIHIYDINYMYDNVYLFYDINTAPSTPVVNWTIAREILGNSNITYSTIYFTENQWTRTISKAMNFMTNDVDRLDYRNIEERYIGNAEEKNTQSRLVAENLTKSLRLMRSTGEYSDIDGLISTGEITFETYYNNLYLPDSGFAAPLNILTEMESYRVINIDDLERLDLMMDYIDINEYATVDNSDEIVFDPAGTIKFIGNNSSYTLSMVFNDGHHTTPWYKTTIEGTDADEITMEQTEDGIVVTGDNLNNLTITATDEDGDTELKVSTDKISILITNNTKDEPIVLIDSDDDGTYDTDITNTTADEPEQPKNTMIFPKLFNVTVEVGEGGKTNVSDTFLIAYGASRTIKITPDEGYEVADVVINGMSVGAVEKYSIRGANSNYTVEITFKEID